VATREESMEAIQSLERVPTRAGRRKARVLKRRAVG
jgi:hypothetical protein